MNFDPKKEGPGYWAIFHLGSLKAITLKDKKEFARRFAVDIASFPCLKCREHATGYIVDHPLDPYIISKEGYSMFRYINEFHNFVNGRLHLKTYTLEESLPIWIKGTHKLIKGYWAAFHVRALNAKSKTEKHEAARMIMLDILNIEIDDKLRQCIKENPVSGCIVDSDELCLFRWTVKVHNCYNKLRGKPEIDFLDCYEIWDPINYCKEEVCGESVKDNPE